MLNPSVFPHSVLAVPAGHPRRLLRCLACLLLSGMLLALPALAAASTLADDLSALSDEELLLLKQLIDAEVEARGWLSLQTALLHPTNPSSGFPNPGANTIAKAPAPT